VRPLLTSNNLSYATLPCRTAPARAHGPMGALPVPFGEPTTEIPCPAWDFLVSEFIGHV
jgi:hypothetical protein